MTPPQPGGAAYGHARQADGGTCANPRHAHTLNAAIHAAHPEDDDDPATWAHCPDCHADDYDHGTDPGGPRCGHWAGCPHC